MSLPLTDFMEIIETHMNDPYMSDEELGKRVRIEWATMQAKEAVEVAFTGKATRPDGENVTVTIPKRG